MGEERERVIANKEAIFVRKGNTVIELRQCK
jgi:hypothetical protein